MTEERRKQRTVNKPVELQGPGLHSGQETLLTIKPAPIDTGYVFIRTDIGPDAQILAIADNVTDTSRGTTIGTNGWSVSTVEHLLAAAYSLGIDNAYFELNGPEVPILDGSSRYFIEAFYKAGVKEQNAFIKVYDITENLNFFDKERGIDITIYPDSKYRLKVLVDYNSDALASQYADLNDLEDFPSQISKCRTFVFVSELEPLLSLNLIKGGDLDNAIVIVDQEWSQEEFDRLTKLFNKPKIKVQSQGILNNVELYYANEPARHKLLDLVGDLALTGFRFNGSVVATKPGHFGNTKMAKIIRDHILKQSSEKEKIKRIPQYNPNDEVLMDVNKIKTLLPHRHPFLLVDKIVSLNETEVVGIKTVTNGEYYFPGHFPEEPVMPGVLQIEAMAQTGGILILSTVPDPENYLTFFMKIDNVKFRKKVGPGDVLVMKLTLMEPMRRGIAHMKGEAYVGNSLVVEAEMYALIEKQK
ncbi:MAG: bifunctional UDP-3-O-[3-hydroxymyristoyl] N-acetylglucosamine deacetylase/3-hydroxyacyl-ACP dehydratase [Bacteroidales bacterium]|nr:bifunctional UDP-3-O-[3-hydroxymyristoyl] N-acetylglucosamine deacetylase/3-hydroxyacyl-ACP dehydratase [Bacteroidales bacterium]